MGREDHLKKLEEKLNSKTIVFDAESLWDELEPRLPKKKKRRGFFFWLLLGMISVTVTGGYYYFNKDLSKNKTENENKKPNIAQQLPQDEVIQNLEYTIDNKPNTVQNNVHKAEDLETKTKATGTLQNELNNLNQQQKENEPIQSESIDLHLNQTSTEIVDQEKAIQTILNETETTVQLSSKHLFQHEVTTATNDEIRDEESTEKILQTSDTSSENHPLIDTQRSNNSALTNVLTNNQSEDDKISNIETIEKNIALISTLPLLNNSLNFEQNFPVLIKQPNHSIIKFNQKESPWIFSLSTEAHVFKNFEQRNNVTDYANTLDELTSLQLGYSYGIRLTARQQKGIFLGVGIQRITNFEKFEFQNEFTRIEEITNDQAFLFEGEFIAQTQEVRKTIRQNVLQYNELTHVNISPFLGYRIQGYFNYDFSIAPLISLSHKGTGYLIDDEQVLITDIGPLYDRNGIAFNGFSFEIGISKNIMKNLELGLNLSVVQQSKNTADENMDFSRKIISIGPGIQFNYFLN